MDNINTYFQYLSFLCLDPEREFWSKNCMASKSDCLLPMTNRAYIPDQVHQTDIEELKSFFGDRAFTIWMDKENLIGLQQIEKIGLKRRTQFPVMLADLKQMADYVHNPEIEIKQISSTEEIFSLWIPLVCKAYNKVDIQEFSKYIRYLLSTPESKNMRFYIGYYQGQPCATNLLILKNNITGVHWVGTLPEYRNKGLGYAISCYPLHEVKSTISKAILYASEMGKPVYEKIGFNTLTESYVYDYVNEG